MLQMSQRYSGTIGLIQFFRYPQGHFLHEVVILYIETDYWGATGSYIPHC